MGAAQEWSRRAVVRKGERRVWKKDWEDWRVGVSALFVMGGGGERG